MRVSIGRSWTRNEVGDRRRGARARRRRGRRSARRRRCRSSSPAARRRRRAAGGAAAQYGSITPSSAERGRDGGATRRVRPARREHDRALAAAQQRRLDRRRARPARPAASRSGAISANGFSSRCLRARRVATAPRRRRRQARWKPPMPLTATIAPSRSATPRRRPRRLRPVRVDEPRRGPQSGHAFGWAWKRRSAGSSYSAWQRSHIAKPAIVVSGRSYGHAAHDREARAAVRAVDERVAVAAVGGVEQLAQARLAGRRVGRDERVGGAPPRARRDREPGLAARRRRPPASTPVDDAPAAAPRPGSAGEQRVDGLRRRPRPRSRRRARRCGRSRRGRARPRAGTRTAGSRRPGRRPRRGTRDALAIRRAVIPAVACAARRARARRACGRPRKTARSRPFGQSRVEAEQRGRPPPSKPIHTTNPKSRPGPRRGGGSTRGASRTRRRANAPMAQCDELDLGARRARATSCAVSRARRVLADQAPRCLENTRIAGHRHRARRRRGTIACMIIDLRRARGGRGRRSPAPPGCAGCAASG